MGNQSVYAFQDAYAPDHPRIGEAMISLTPEMQDSISNARASGNPCIVATAARDGTPDMGYIGTMMALSDSTLAYKNRENNATLVSPEENPKVIVIYRNAATGVGWKFRCTAVEYEEGPYFDAVNSRLSPTGGDTAHTGTVVVLEIDQVLTLFGEVLQERTSGRRW